MFYFLCIQFLKLNGKTKISDLETLAQRQDSITMMAAEDVPEELSNIPIGQIVYLAGEVSAFTTRKYLSARKLTDTMLDISKTNNKGEFCPVPPNYFVKVKG